MAKNNIFKFKSKDSLSLTCKISPKKTLWWEAVLQAKFLKFFRIPWTAALASFWD